MRIHLLAVGQKMPRWVEEGYREYAARLRGEIKLELVEIRAARRTRNSAVARLMEEEGERLLAAIPARAHVVALDVQGRAESTERLASRMEDWMRSGNDVVLLIGGPDGLSPAALQRADTKLSLSPLTFPHPLVRILVAEQLYRAYSVLRGHPYHRAD
ncbi:MAG: 23S rRNA (pseudouridine(1915)-N(3))-methyltransferase RlmH [Pseudomonadota bacterium]